MNTWWYIHTATLHQLSSRWTPDNRYILHLYINFPADEHVMIYTYRNFTLTFLPMITWWYIHTATLCQFSCRWTRDDIYIPQLYINFSADEHLMIYTYRNFISTFVQMNTWWYTYRNFISIFLQMNTWWYIHTATLHQLSSRWTPDNRYIPQLYINFPADEHLMIYTYGNLISTFLQMNTWWYIHTVTL